MLYSKKAITFLFLFLIASTPFACSRPENVPGNALGHEKPPSEQSASASADPPVDPTDAPVDPTDAPVDPTDAPVDPTDAPVAPTDAPVDPTDAPVEVPATPPPTAKSTKAPSSKAPKMRRRHLR